MERPEPILRVVHNLKSPLLAIERLSELLLRDEDQVPEDIRKDLELIRESATEASEYLKKLTSSAALREETASEAEMESVDVSQITEDVVDGLRPNAEHKDQMLQHSIADAHASYHVEGVPFQLREAVHNLVSNALKFSPRGERVDVQVGREEEAVTISVTDNGPGLRTENRGQLFEAFQTGSADPTGREESTGIGLYIVEQITQKHGGRVEIESEQGKGSTFKLLLPVASSSSSSSKRPAKESAETGESDRTESQVPV